MSYLCWFWIFILNNCFCIGVTSFKRWPFKQWLSWCEMHKSLGTSAIYTYASFWKNLQCFFIICTDEQLYKQSASDLHFVFPEIVLLWAWRKENDAQCKAGNMSCDYSLYRYTETDIFHVWIDDFTVMSVFLKDSSPKSKINAYR